MCQGRASFPRPFSIPGAVLYSALCSVSYLPTQKHYTGQMHTGLVDGHLLHPALPSGPGYLNQNSASLTKSLPARNPQTSCSEPKDAPLHQVCLDGFHGTRRGPHKRNTVCIGAHAPQLPARLVESRAAPIKARTGRVVKHQQHRHSACRSSRGVASSARGHRAHREAPRRWFVNLFPKEGSLHRGGLLASLRSGFLLPFKHTASWVSQETVISSVSSGRRAAFILCWGTPWVKQAGGLRGSGPLL